MVPARPNVNSHSEKLIASFECTIGHIEKDYSKYLDVSTCPFNFALSTEAYKILVGDLQRSYFRAGMKKLLAHLAQYAKQIDDGVLQIVCEVCNRERAGLTLMEFIQLVVKN